MPQTNGAILTKLRGALLITLTYLSAIALMLVAVALELKALDMLVRLILS